MIHAHVTGRLTRNSEMKTVGENQVLNFALATDHGFGNKKTTIFINAAIWGKRGESLASYLTKGSQIVCHGELFTRDYQAKDGTTKTSLEMRVNEVDLVGGKSDNGGKSEESPSYKAQAPSTGQDFEDEVPF
jgi:single-strand DNA-binding protein